MLIAYSVRNKTIMKSSNVIRISGNQQYQLFIFFMKISKVKNNVIPQYKITLFIQTVFKLVVTMADISLPDVIKKYNLLISLLFSENLYLFLT